MTTRRGFIQGVLVAIGATVMPKAAEAAPIDGPDVAPDMGALNASARNAAGAITEQAQALDFATERFVRFGGEVSQELLDDGAWFGGLLAKWTEEAGSKAAAPDYKLAIHVHDSESPDEDYIMGYWV
jgi:hypothetical protein